MVNSVVIVRDLDVVRGKAEVLSHIDADIGPGVTGLLGPSGSGKTTLLRAVLGVQRIRSGQVEVLGRPAGSRELRSKVGYASQAAAVYDDLTVLENLRYFAAILRLPDAEVERVLKAVDLEPKAHSLTGRMSGGQRSRVSLAVSMLGRPAVLILDEPTVGLDPVLREQLWDLFHTLADDGAAVLVSSHVMDEAERCDTLLMLREGKVLARGTPTELKNDTGADTMEGAFLKLVRAA